MANNCYNYIEINGDKKEIKEFVKIIESGGTDYEKYGLLVDAFGKSENDPKWFEMDLDVRDKESIGITGDSAWCPALELFTKVSERYKSFQIRYKYEEGGCDFSGWADICDGVCDDNCFTYWKGLFEMNGEDDMMEYIIVNEIDACEKLEDLVSTDFFGLLSDENKKEVLKEFHKQKENEENGKFR